MIPTPTSLNLPRLTLNSTRWRTILKILFYVFCPFHTYGSKYFEYYLKVVRYHKLPSVRHHWFIFSMDFVLLYHILHMTIHGYFYHPKTRFELLVACDIFEILGIDRTGLREMNVLISIMMMFMNRYLILNQNLDVIEILEKILNNKISSTCFIGDNKIKQHNVKVVRRFFYVLLNLCNSMLLAMGFITIFLICYSLYEFWILKTFFFSLGGIFLLIVTLMNLFMTIIMLLIYCHQFTILMTSSMSLCLILMMNFRFLLMSLEINVRKQSLTPQKFTVFNQCFQRNFKLFLLCNRVYSKPIFLFLLCNIPSSANVMIQFFSHSINDNQIVYWAFCSACFNQVFLIVVIHAFFTKPIKAIHSYHPVLYTFLSERFSLSEKFDLNTIFKIALFLRTFHTKNVYGFTYANISVISMSTLCKYSAIYSKFIMIAYKVRFNMYWINEFVFKFKFQIVLCSKQQVFQILIFFNRYGYNFQCEFGTRKTDW